MSSTVTAIEADHVATARFDRRPASPEIGVDDLELAIADAAVARLRAAARSRATAEAELAAAVVGVADLCDDREHDSSEVAAVLAWSPRFAESEVGWCRNLIEELPAVFAAWRDGRIDRHRARVFEDCLAALILVGSGDDARAIAERILPEAGRITPPRLRAKLLRLVLKIDPQARRKQAAQTVADRDVWLGDVGDGATASLTAFHLPVARAAAAFERVDAIARARRAGGDARTLAQLRADTVLDLLDGTGCDTPPIGRQGVLELHIPLATAIGADATPGELAGYGPVLADVARQIARQRGDVQWRFSVTYRGELVYQGITSTRPDPDGRGDTCAGSNGATSADPTAAGLSSPKSNRVIGSARCAAATATMPADGSGIGDSKSCGSTTGDSKSDAAGSSKSIARGSRSDDSSAGGSSNGHSRSDGRGTDAPWIAASGTIRPTTSNSGDAIGGGCGSGIDGSGRGNGGVACADSHDECGRAGLARPESRARDHGAARSVPALVDYLTGRPITAVSKHSPHPPIETDPRRRFPGEKLKRWIAARDRSCRAPGCHAPARVCQFDHTIDYADGGQTAHDDLALLCEHHHSEKHAGWWTVIQPAPGRIYWITPHGHIYHQSD